MVLWWMKSMITLKNFMIYEFTLKTIKINDKDKMWNHERKK